MKRIISKILKFRDERDWAQFHDPKNLSAAISIESSELQELFLWLTTEEAQKLPKARIASIADELADIFIFSIYMCHFFNIDLIEATEVKLKKNIQKYPIEKAKGSRVKYTDL